MSEHHIYFVAVGRPPFEAVKIGYARDVQSRLRAYRVTNPYGPTLLGSFPGGPNTEAFLLRKFKRWHIRGEWFELTDESRALMQRAIAEGMPDLDAEEAARLKSTSDGRPPPLRLITQDREATAKADAEAVTACAGAAIHGESRKQMLLRSARNSGLSYPRIVAFYYAKGNPPEEARSQLVAAAERISRGIAA